MWSVQLCIIMAFYQVMGKLAGISFECPSAQLIDICMYMIWMWEQFIFVHVSSAHF